MSNISFNFGHNVHDNADPWGRKDSGNKDVNGTNNERDFWIDICCKKIKTMVAQITETVRKANRTEINMDLGQHRSSNGKTGKFENREWLSSEDLPVKGSKKFKIDNVREAKRNKTGVLAYVDLSAGKTKRVWSLRKGFTLDIIMDQLGTKTEKWKGKTISLYRGGSEGQYVNAVQ